MTKIKFNKKKLNKGITKIKPAKKKNKKTEDKYLKSLPRKFFEKLNINITKTNFS